MLPKILGVVGLVSLIFAFLFLLIGFLSPSWIRLTTLSKTPISQLTNTTIQGIWCSEKYTREKFSSGGSHENTAISCRFVIFVSFATFVMTAAQLSGIGSIVFTALALVFGFKIVCCGHDMPIVRGMGVFPFLLAFLGAGTGASVLLAMIFWRVVAASSPRGETTVSFLWGYYVYLLGVFLAFVAALLLLGARQLRPADPQQMQTGAGGDQVVPQSQQIHLGFGGRQIQQGYVVQSSWLPT